MGQPEAVCKARSCVRREERWWRMRVVLRALLRAAASGWACSRSCSCSCSCSSSSSWAIGGGGSGALGVPSSL